MMDMFLNNHEPKFPLSMHASVAILINHSLAERRPNLQMMGKMYLLPMVLR